MPEQEKVAEWVPRSDLGKKVKAGEIKSIDEIFEKGLRITEPGIVDQLLSDVETVFLSVGQSKGKFGGGKRKIYKHTQKKVREGSKIKFAFMAAVGNRNGYIGVGYGTSRRSISARLTAEKNAKLNLTKVLRGCGSWECGCGGNHSIPSKTVGKNGSVTVELMPAPKGTGLVANDEAKKILDLAGIRDIWSKTFGESRSRVNYLNALFNSLKELNMFRG